ncbi:hypothetical protein Pmar_PMAR018716, partial [Perkinsus marinus ATCC 50983]
HRESNSVGGVPKSTSWEGLTGSPRMHYRVPSTRRTKTKPEMGRRQGSPSRKLPSWAENLIADEPTEPPKIRLGEAGRSRLKAILSQSLRNNPGLRAVCNSIARLKSATVQQLLRMAEVCGCMDQAMAIARDFHRTRAIKSRKPRTSRSSQSSNSMIQSAFGGVRRDDVSTGNTELHSTRSWMRT